jgi:hypothetical protein
MSKSAKTYSFYGSSEIERLLREFQRQNHIQSKSKAIKVLLDAGLRNWSHPQEEKENDRPVSRRKEISLNKPLSPGKSLSHDKRTKREYYELITGSSS